MKGRIRAAHLRAATAVNRELVLLDRQIGRGILDRHERENRGAKEIDRLASDLKVSLPDVKRFSPRNLKKASAFAEAWPDEAIVQQRGAQNPWGAEDRIWYTRAIIQYGWSREVQVHQIESWRPHRQ